MLVKITQPIYKQWTQEVVFTPGQVVRVEHDLGTALIVMPLGVSHKARRVDIRHCEALSGKERVMYEMS